MKSREASWRRRLLHWGLLYILPTRVRMRWKCLIVTRFHAIIKIHIGVWPSLPVSPTWGLNNWFRSKTRFKWANPLQRLRIIWEQTIPREEVTCWTCHSKPEHLYLREVRNDKTKRRPWWSSGYLTRLWIRGSLVQIRPGSMDFFRV